MSSEPPLHHRHFIEAQSLHVPPLAQWPTTISSATTLQRSFLPMDMPFGSQILGIYIPPCKLATSATFRKAKFHRLFNALLPAEDESHADFGVPEYHEPLTLNIKKHINIGKLGPNNFCSAKVTSKPVLEVLAKG